MGSLSAPTELLLGPLSSAERKAAPPLLHFLGDPLLLRHSPRIAIVGLREADRATLQATTAIATAVVQASGVVVSGLALGVDCNAHFTAIQRGGRTIAVLGTPLDQCAALDVRWLQSLIGRDHLLVSQFEEGLKVQRSFFPRRNRTMAVIAEASIIVQSRDGGGTLSHAREALRLRRPVFIAPIALLNRSLTWPQELLAAGAVELRDIERVCEKIRSRRDASIESNLWE